MKLRRCKEEREDFTYKDGGVFPFYVLEGGTPYGFCPGKSTWESSVVNRFKKMHISALTSLLPEDGGLDDQEEDFINDFHSFVVRFKQLESLANNASIFGTGNTNGAQRKTSSRSRS